MKKLFPLLAICLAFTYVSCEQETQPVVHESSNIKALFNEQNRPPGGDLDPCCHEENMFERQLHWFSYLSAELFVDNPSLRSQLSSLLATNGGNQIPASELIGPTSQTPAFNAAFYDRLVWYYDEWTGWPSTDQTNPPFPPGSGGTPGNNQGNMMADQYYDIILNQNCVELYFPNGIDFKLTYPSATSSAHPLTRSGANEGIRFSYDGISNDYNSEEVVVNDTNVINNINVMVARPVRLPPAPASGPDCTYQEYSSINFTDFLD